MDESRRYLLLRDELSDKIRAPIGSGYELVRRDLFLKTG